MFLQMFRRLLKSLHFRYSGGVIRLDCSSRQGPLTGRTRCTVLIPPSRFLRGEAPRHFSFSLVCRWLSCGFVASSCGLFSFYILSEDLSLCFAYILAGAGVADNSSSPLGLLRPPALCGPALLLGRLAAAGLLSGAWGRSSCWARAFSKLGRPATHYSPTTGTGNYYL